MEQLQVNPELSSKLLSDFDYSLQNPANREMLSNIATRISYERSGLYQTIKVEDVDREGALLHTNNSTGQVNVSILGGKINSLLNDANNLGNSIEHEKEHVTDKSTAIPLNHAQVVVNQMGLSSFTNTTEEFKSAMPGYISSNLNTALQQGAPVQNVQNVIDNANKFSAQTKVDLFISNDQQVMTSLHLDDVQITGKRAKK
jgi:hypothetical protein